jgi:hypothetical protein
VDLVDLIMNQNPSSAHQEEVDNLSGKILSGSMDLQPPSSTSSPSKRGKDAHTIAAYFFLQVFGIHPLRKISEIIISQKEFITCCPGGGISHEILPEFHELFREIWLTLLCSVADPEIRDG